MATVFALIWKWILGVALGLAGGGVKTVLSRAWQGVLTVVAGIQRIVTAGISAHVAVLTVNGAFLPWYLGMLALAALFGALAHSVFF